MDNIKKQIEDLRVIIKENVATLQKLVSQHDQLTVLIEDLSKDDKNIPLKEKFEKLKQDISNSIETLVLQTEQLVKTYKDFIKQANR